jgi:hypothetical protein
MKHKFKEDCVTDQEIQTTGVGAAGTHYPIQT